MKLIRTIEKPHGLKAFTFSHIIRNKTVEITTLAMNESNGQTKAWKRASELYKAEGKSKSDGKN